MAERAVQDGDAVQHACGDGEDAYFFEHDLAVFAAAAIDEETSWAAGFGVSWLTRA